MASKPSPQPYSRPRIASVFTGLGLLVLVSGLLINPWIGRLYRSNMINFRDVMLSYSIWAAVIGLLIIGSGLVLRSTDSKRIENIALLVVTCLLIVLSDRLLLARLGLPLWVSDVENLFRQRPNVVRTWANKSTLIRINRYGYHDDNFPVEKPDNELRGLIIGDSVVMAHQMTSEETVSNRLEELFREGKGDYRSYQIINAGVQGYSTYQEYNVLMDCLVFKPDFIAVGFCMNDLSEPFYVDERLGGVGLDYHGIRQASSSIVGYFLNETGYGRLLQRFQKRNKSIELAKRKEMYDLQEIAKCSVDDPRFAVNWGICLSGLDKIYDVATDNKIRVVLLIFPFTFQLMDDSIQQPQRILVDHANSRSIDVIDFTKVFEDIIFDKDQVASLAAKGFSYQNIHKRYEAGIRRYFLDNDHFTAEGHKIVADRLYAYLSQFYSPSRQL